MKAARLIVLGVALAAGGAPGLSADRVDGGRRPLAPQPKAAPDLIQVSAGLSEIFGPKAQAARRFDRVGSALDPAATKRGVTRD
jgi:hypothetical protein